LIGRYRTRCEQKSGTGRLFAGKNSTADRTTSFIRLAGSDESWRLSRHSRRRRRRRRSDTTARPSPGRLFSVDEAVVAAGRRNAATRDRSRDYSLHRGATDGSASRGTTKQRACSVRASLALIRTVVEDFSLFEASKSRQS